MQSSPITDNPEYNSILTALDRLTERVRVFQYYEIAF